MLHPLPKASLLFLYFTLLHFNSLITHGRSRGTKHKNSMETVTFSLLSLLFHFWPTYIDTTESVTTDLMGHGITLDMDLPEAFVTNVS